MPTRGAAVIGCTLLLASVAVKSFMTLGVPLMALIFHRLPFRSPAYAVSANPSPSASRASTAVSPLLPPVSPVSVVVTVPLMSPTLMSVARPPEPSGPLPRTTRQSPLATWAITGLPIFLPRDAMSVAFFSHRNRTFEGSVISSAKRPGPPLPSVPTSTVFHCEATVS